MNELIDEIKTLYKYFNNEQYFFFAVFLISIIFICIIEKNKKIKDFFVWYSIIILAIIWNPICVYFFNKMINIASMYRIYYLLPMYLVIAYAGTKIIEMIKNKAIKLIVLFVMISIIVVKGGPIFSIYTTTQVYNQYKLPAESVNVAYMIAEDTKTEYKKAIVPYDGMSAQIRQVTPEIEMYYSRIVSNPTDENGKALPYDTDAVSGFDPVSKINEGDVPYIANLCAQANINYVVFHRMTPLSDKMENYGFELFNETTSYLIYRKIN